MVSSKSSLPTRRGAGSGSKQSKQSQQPGSKGPTLYDQLTATPASVKAARSSKLGAKGGSGSSDPITSTKTARRIAKREASGAKEGGGTFVDPKTTRKILSIVREQQEELEREHGVPDATVVPVVAVAAAVPSRDAGMSLAAPAPSQSPLDSEDEDHDMIATPGAEGGHEEDEVYSDFEEYDDEGPQDEQVARLLADEREQAILDAFLAPEPRKQLQLSDLVMSKIQSASEHTTGGDGAATAVGAGAVGGLNPKIIEVYTKVGLIMSRYKSGKLPKTFKIIPSLANWEEILYLTRPDTWTPQATYEATRVFTSNLKADMAQRFFSHILLERVRQDIEETKKLNVHLYNAVKKSLYKPGAFFKGFLLPLCAQGCTLREAAILGSVLAKVSIPVLHSAAGLLKIAEMEYTGANSLFIRILLDKKYALPYKVIDALVSHFLRFKHDRRECPVLWHQSLLVFCQRYKEDLAPEQKEALLDLTKHKWHEGISPEVRRELVGSGYRDELMGDTLEAQEGEAAADVMMEE